MDHVLPMIEAGPIFFPEGAACLAVLLIELLGFPAGRHDDRVDSVSQYLGWAFERSGKVMFDCDWLDGYDTDPTPEEIAERMAEHRGYQKRRNAQFARGLAPWLPWHQTGAMC